MPRRCVCRKRLSVRTDASIGAAAVGIRIVSAILALLILLAFGAAHDIPSESTMWGKPSPFWDAFVRHDSGWYFDIARNGYDFSGPMGGGRSNIAYAPVYPLLMRYVGRLFGRAPGDIYLGGIAVSWAAFVLAMIALHRLAALDVGDESGVAFGPAARAVLLTAIFPFSFFFGAVYTESTFLLFTILSFYGFRRRQWVLGGVCGALAGATRVTGILMWPALAWTAWRAASSPRDRIRAAAALVIATTGFAAYCLYVYWESGDPFLWATALTRWGAGYHPGGMPWSAPIALARALMIRPYVYLTSGPMAAYDALYGVTALAFVVATPFVWRRFGAAYGLFMAANLYVPLSSGSFEGLGRYCSVLFPCFIWLGSLRSARLFTALAVVFAMFYTLGLAMFVTLRPLF